MSDPRQQQPPEWFVRVAHRPAPPPDPADRRQPPGGWPAGLVHPGLTRPAPRPDQPVWVGAAPAAFYPGTEDATQLIQRITNEAVPEEIYSGETTLLPAVPPQPKPPAGQAAEPAAGEADATADMRTSKTSGVVRASALMAIATVFSRLTGLVSKVAISGLLGGSIVLSSYTIANTLPNIIFELLLGGVLTSVAIPLLTRAQRSDPDGGLEYTQRLMTMAVLALLVATGVAMASAPLLTRLYLSDGDSADPGQATMWSYLLLPQIFFYGLAALFGAILNSKERFAANAWAPVVNNLVVIAVAVGVGVVGFRHSTPDHIADSDMLLLGLGTTAGIAAQAVVMVPSLRRAGFRWKWRWGLDKRFAEAGRLLLWATAYVVVSQVGVVVTNRVASAESKGGVGFFSLASLIFQMPYGILGVAVLTAIMPRMSRHAAAGELKAVKDDMSLANRLSAVALLPVSAGLLVLGAAIGTVLFRMGRMTVENTVVIGGVITGMAVGLLPLAMTLVQMRVFYAVKDGRTPVIINAIMVAVRVPLMMYAGTFADPDIALAGLAVATAVSYLVGAVVGEIWLRARFGPMGSRRTMVTVVKMTIASALGGVAAYFATDRTIGLVPRDLTDAVKILLLGGGVGLAVIAVTALVLQVEELVPVRNRILRLLGRRPAVTRSAPSASVPPTPVPPGRAAGSVPPATGGHQVTGAPATAAQPRPAARSVQPRPTSQEIPPVKSTPAGPPEPPGDDERTSIVSGPTAADPTIVTSGEDMTVNVGPRSTQTGSRPVTPLAPGATVGGRYRLVNLVGTDSAGNRFWRAKDSVLPRDMAVTLLPDTSAASATVARTLRVGRLHHIGLPQTLDLGTENGQSYVVGQWVDGATLTDLLAGGPLEPDVATSITARLAEAVAEAHRNGIALGAINPGLVRVNFDGQVRLSHVIAHGNATPDQDIRAVGAVLYLMLTGTWPLSSPMAGTADPNVADPTVRLGGTTGVLPPAPTRRGREVPAIEVRPGIPEALSALAERALHPEEPSGIHAVSAIAALLRKPEPVAGEPGTAAPEAPQVPQLSAGERRLIKERRIKLSIAGVMLAAFSALIIIIVASMAKQVMDSVGDPAVLAGPSSAAPATSEGEKATATAATTPSTSATTAPSTSQNSTSGPPTTTSAQLPPAAPVKIVSATVYDPEGDWPQGGSRDNVGQVPRAFDGDPTSSWQTFDYNQQFPTAKTGVGLTLELEKEVTVVSVTVTSDTPDTTIEVRSTPGVDAPLTATKVLGSATITNQPVTINLKDATKSKYLIVWVTKLAPKPGTNKFKSDISEITLTGR